MIWVLVIGVLVIILVIVLVVRMGLRERDEKDPLQARLA